MSLDACIGSRLMGLFIWGQLLILEKMKFKAVDSG